MYRMVAVDLDGTLLGPDKSIHPDNQRAITGLIRRGVEVVLASGRRYDNMLPFQQRLGLVGPMVSCQGADVRDGDFVAQCFLRRDLAEDVIDFARQRNATIVAYAKAFTQVERRDALVHLYETRALTHVQTVPDLMASADAMFKIILSVPAADMPPLAAEVRRRFNGSVKTVLTEADTFEIMTPGIDKAGGMAALAERRGLSKDQVVALGDGDNDVELLRWAGLGIAMSNATPAAIAAAKLKAAPGDPANSLARAIGSLMPLG
ncbi:MAG TPA: HAD family hydrolase [Candidatus Xenobia bacterium]|jgi:hypothetical protein